MASDLRELYQEVILDHNKKPRNFREMEPFDRKVEGFNPLCGDRLTLFMKIEDGVIKDVTFQGSGCAISTASASMMTEALVGKTFEEAEQMFSEFHDLVTGDPTDEPKVGEHLDKLEIFAGIREFPARVKCATLCWHTAKAALEGGQKSVSTE
ncbi:MAG: SUF system NifU family Fe-S cluster assembly protein [Deltaproteobacteria bacterium]|nr:SUF system NifU family Fe-S cluster assembly protein [bacterium]MCB9476650.1 SUF system NifU family Fe-S cluster assembly protein [Deltaproteobacteria bacterium]MCB9479597.1 SUF system NifU family Fe-S cluster assembly protein [Deltaproteobacteria bacterium]MCB9488833.1 SUF system NifU family Fe-S cluster assembly protein [Deltaproteobacteria bacterium]